MPRALYMWKVQFTEKSVQISFQKQQPILLSPPSPLGKKRKGEPEIQVKEQKKGWIKHGSNQYRVYKHSFEQLQQKIAPSEPLV